MNSSIYQVKVHRLTLVGLLFGFIVGSEVGSYAAGGASDAAPNQKSGAAKSIQDQATDMTDRQGDLQGKYDVVAVRRGELIDEKGGHLDQVVRNKKGETLGSIKKLLKDVKTGKIEYVVLEVVDTKYQLPLQWSQIYQESGKLILHASKSDLDPTNSPVYSKNLSPDLSHYMNEINQVRDHPKPKSGAGKGSLGTGESEVGGSGP